MWLAPRIEPAAATSGRLSLMLVAAYAALVAPRGWSAGRSVFFPIVAATASVASMATSVAAMSEHMHRDECYADQYPKPICR